MVEVTSLSSKGQVVIPLLVREKMHLKEGEKFIVIEDSQAIILRRLEPPSVKELDRLLRKTRAFSKAKHLTEDDLKKAIEEIRKK